MKHSCKLGISFLLLIPLAACLDNRVEGVGGSCNCYVNSECTSPLVCHTGVDCTEGLHTTKAQPQEGIFESTVNNIGLCKEFGPHEPLIPGEQLGNAVGAYLDSLRISAASGGGAANYRQVRKALASGFSPEQHSAIRNFVTLIAMHTLGPAPGVGRGYVHRPGSYQPPTPEELSRKGSDSTPSIAIRELGSVQVADDATLAGFSHIVSAIVAEIENPNQGAFRQEMMTLRTAVPDYRPFDACQYPHPQEHGHLFAFADDIDCITVQIEGALDTLLNH